MVAWQAELLQFRKVQVVVQVAKSVDSVEWKTLKTHICLPSVAKTISLDHFVIVTRLIRTVHLWQPLILLYQIISTAYLFSVRDSVTFSSSYRSIASSSGGKQRIWP